MDNATAENVHPITEPAPSVALVKRSPFELAREFVAYLKDIDIIAESLSKSTLLPKEMQTPANLRLVLAQGLEMGFSPLQAVRATFVIPGSKDGYTPAKLGYYVQALIALVHSRGKCRFFRVDETNGKRCRVSCARSDEAADVVHSFELTIEQARDAKMNVKWTKENGQWVAEEKHPWKTAPADMLMWRVCGRAAKAVFPDVVFGMSTPDEIEDLVAADAMDNDKSGGFVAIPHSPPRAAAASSSPPPSSSAAAATPATSPEIVDAELVPDETTAAPSGDPAWDQFLHEIAQLTNDREMLQAFPPEMTLHWDARLVEVKTRKDLNALAPWIGAANKRASQSKACAELGAHMQKSFNEHNAKIREAERAAAAAAKGGAK